MTFLNLPAPDWAALVGGDESAEAWLAARGRKLAKAAESVPTIFITARELEAAGALFRCTPEVLTRFPHAARFYLDLLALSPKTLDKITGQVGEYEFSVKPETIANNLGCGRTVNSHDIRAFARFVNDQIAAVLPVDSRTFDVAVGTVLIVHGARVQGSVQNEAGNDAVLLLKTLLVAAMSERGHSVEVSRDFEKWEDVESARARGIEALSLPHLRFGEWLTCEFTPGGNRPDIRIAIDGVLVASGEIKGRKDLANLWESWMPQIAGHFRTWTMEAPDAPRLFFGTIVTKEMISGHTEGGTQHAGLKTLKSSGLLSAAYNLSLIASGDSSGTAEFTALVDQLSDLISDRASSGSKA